jgi:hypothetical protein
LAGQQILTTYFPGSKYEWYVTAQAIQCEHVPTANQQLINK